MYRRRVFSLSGARSMKNCDFSRCTNKATVRLLREDGFSTDWFANVCERCFSALERLLQRGVTQEELTGG